MDPFAPIEVFDPFAEITASAEAAKYGGADWCPIDDNGNYLCICA